MPDAFHVFGMDEVIASFPYDVYRSQIHVITNPTKGGTQSVGLRKEQNRDTAK
jgi:hypothetical protein